MVAGTTAPQVIKGLSAFVSVAGTSAQACFTRYANFHDGLSRLCRSHGIHSSPMYIQPKGRGPHSATFIHSDPHNGESSSDDDWSPARVRRSDEFAIVNS